MHVVTMIVVGIVLLIAFVLGATLITRQGASGQRSGAWWFIWVWLAVSIANGAVGYFEAGVPLATELAAFIPIFGAPAAVAWYVARRAVEKT